MLSPSIELNGNSPNITGMMDSLSTILNQKAYDGYAEDNEIPEGGHKLFSLEFPDPFLLVSFFDKEIAEGRVTLHPWQMEELEFLGQQKPTSKTPCKYVLVGNNGSGKDKFIIAPFAIWFCLTKIRARVIITTASGQQLTAQTEPYLKDLAYKVNAFFGKEVFRVRQRFIKCFDTGSEIRMFATDEAGKAEGFHPIDANSEMAIVVNEGKSVTEDIHKALRRCTGFNYWLEVSSAGEPKGYFHYAAMNWPHVRYITSYECPHISDEEREEDKFHDGESSAYYRSKHLSEFTSVGGMVVITLELINACIKHPPTFSIIDFPKRVGIDLAKGGNETALCLTKGNRVISEKQFSETDATVVAQKCIDILKSWDIDKDSNYIFADDGGVGGAIIDILVTNHHWNIQRINNQWPALGNKKRFGNRGAENWFRIQRILEEKVFDISNITNKTKNQLYNRYYRQVEGSGKIFLESKKEAIKNGRPSPDRADAFILAMTGLTVEDFTEAKKANIDEPEKPRVSDQTYSTKALEEHYDNEFTYKEFSLDKKEPKRVPFPSLKQLIEN